MLLRSDPQTHTTWRHFWFLFFRFVRQSHEQPNVVCHRRRVGVVVYIYLVCSSRTPPYQMRSTIFRVSFAPLPFLFSLTLVLFYLVFRSVPFRVGFWCFVAVSIHLFSSYIRFGVARSNRARAALSICSFTPFASYPHEIAMVYVCNSVSMYACECVRTAYCYIQSSNVSQSLFSIEIL